MKKVLITGGTGAIGSAIVAAFSNKDYDVWFSYQGNEATAKELATRTRSRAIKIAGGDISKVPADFDVLINCAGTITFGGPTETVADKDMADTLDANLILPFKLSKLMLPHMKQKKWGRIINISSTNSIRPETEVVAYNVSKSALNAMTKTIAEEYGVHGITCNAVAPSLVVGAAGNGSGMRALEYYGEKVEACADANPSGRLATPEDIANACAFLAGNSAAFINGIILPVDGGYTI
ncbi:MAG: SDR family oxidoreductase [Alphaproteobacteria bacterium]|nr:SDR family oxidoreductase [Alphaproteobacteria bacterium]